MKTVSKKLKRINILINLFTFLFIVVLGCIAFYYRGDLINQGTSLFVLIIFALFGLLSSAVMDSQTEIKSFPVKEVQKSFHQNKKIIPVLNELKFVPEETEKQIL